MIREFQVRVWGTEIFSAAWITQEDSPGEHVHLGVNTEVSEDDDDANPFGFAMP